MITRLQALYAPTNQNGKVVVLALVVSLIVAWQTLSILEIGWRDRRLLNQRLLAVQTRQAVFSISSTVLRRFSQSSWRSSVFERLRVEGSINMCLNAQGRLVSSCNSSPFTQGVDVSATIELMNTVLVDLTGDNWSYVQMINRGSNTYQTLRESVSFAVDTMNDEIRVQQRYWLKSP